MSIPNSVRRLGRRLRRFRYLRKAGRVWGPNAVLRADSLKVALRYVLLSSELDTFSFRLANSDDIFEVLGGILKIDVVDLKQFADELLFDESLTKVLPRHMVIRSGRAAHQRENLLGRQVPKYVIARALKPRLIVETGVKDGFGSLALLAAIDRNGRDGHRGNLLSFDINPVAGGAVPEGMRRHWEFVPHSSDEMNRYLRGRGIDFLISDGSFEYSAVSSEVQFTLEAGASQAVVMGNPARNLAIRDASHPEYDKSIASFELIPEDSLYAPQPMDVALFRRLGAARTTPSDARPFSAPERRGATGSADVAE